MFLTFLTSLTNEQRNEAATLNNPDNINNDKNLFPKKGGSIFTAKPPRAAPENIANPLTTLKYAIHLVLFSGVTASYIKFDALKLKPDQNNPANIWIQIR